jgi:hypothetical protein
VSFAAILGLAKAAASSWQYIVMGVLALGLLWFKVAASDCKAGRAADRAAQVEAVLEAQRKADALSTELLTKQADHKRQLDEAANSVRERIVRVPVSTVCRDSPAIGHAIDGVSKLLGGPGGPAPR